MTPGPVLPEQGGRVLALTEHVQSYFPRHAMTEEDGELLVARFGKQIDVEFPTPRTAGRWKLVPQGWIGVCPVNELLTVVSRPKLPVPNLVRMLALVYDLPIDVFPGLVGSRTLPDLYDQLAALLAGEALLLSRQGLYHAYRSTEKRRAAVRGRILVGGSLRDAADVRLECRYSERTPDVLENRILLWTLDRVVRSSLCQESTQRRVREAYRQLLGYVPLVPVAVEDCTRVVYDRLNARYRRVHALCRLFLEGSAPAAESGASQAIPFLLYMPTLFERYVARWLEASVRATGGAWRIVMQERNVVGNDSQVDFNIDLVIYDATTETALCVLDTKYKDVQVPSASDVAQVGYYALLKHSGLAGLVYPVQAVASWEGMSGPVRTFRATFDLGGDLSVAGQAFFRDLTTRIGARY
jgi:5-methylcytosine-specific restriction enzyme subunit McrC